MRLGRNMPLQLTPHPSTGHPFATNDGHRIGHLFRIRGKVKKVGENYQVNSFNWNWTIRPQDIPTFDGCKLAEAARSGRTIEVSAETTADPHGVKLTTGVNLWAW